MVASQTVDFLEVQPKHLSWTFEESPVWVSEVAVDGYHLPRRDAFNSVLSFGGFPIDARITSKGIAYNGVKPFVMSGTDLDVVLARPKLTVMNPLSIIETLASNAGFEIEISDKGAFQDGTIARFGGVDSFAQEYFSERWPIMAKFLDPAGNAPGVHDAGTKLRDRRYLDVLSVSKLLGRQIQDASVRAVVDRYLMMGVLQNGFVLKCKNCRQSDWYAVGDVSASFRCTRCREVQRVEAEVPWTYRLDELVFQFLRNHVEVHVLSLAAMRRQAKNGTFMAIPSFNAFKRPEHASPYAEIDMACIVDGEIIIGECKTNASLTREDKRQLAKYEALGKQLGIDTIVVATIADAWDSAAIAFLRSWKEQLAQFRIQLSIMAAADLKP